MKRLMKKAALALLSGGLVIITGTSQAHHSFAMYDTDQALNFTGKLMRFIPGANHAQILFEVFDEEGNVEMTADGKPLVWGFETGGSAMIARQGVTVKDFPPGTVINISLSPSRNGKFFGVQRGSLIKCGDVFPSGGCTAETGQVFMERRFIPD